MMNNILRALPILSLGFVTPAQSDIVQNDTVIVQGDLCAGSGACVDGEAFGNVDLKIKSASPELRFFDTTASSANNWSLRGDDDAAGADDSFSIYNHSTGAIPFAMSPLAPSSAFWISDFGYVGMGTTLPLAELHISATTDPGVLLEATGATPSKWQINVSNGSLTFQDGNVFTVPVILRSGAPSASLVMNLEGDIGIGALNPEEKLHIQTTADNTDAFALFDAAGTGSDAAFLLRQQGTIPTTWEFRNQESSGRLNVGVVGGNTPLKIDDSANNNLFKIGLNGQPDVVEVTGRLLVNSTELNVPDYVFADDYALRPLADVRSFIDSNSHLPEVPSAADIARDGVDMTEMQMVLLKKVEELTLYTLEQDKLIASHKKTNAQQQRNIAAQQESNAALQDRLDAQETRFGQIEAMLTQLHSKE